MTGGDRLASCYRPRSPSQPRELAGAADGAQPPLGVRPAVAATTISSRSPVSRRVCGSRNEAVTGPDDQARPRPCGSRSSNSSTPCSREPVGICTCSRSARRSSSGADSTSSRLPPSVRTPAADAATAGSVGPCTRVKHDDDQEHEVEQARCVRHGGAHRDRRQHDRHRAAQPGPGQEGLLAPGHPERQAWTPVQRPGGPAAISTRPTTSAGQICAGSRDGEASRPEHHEQADLGEPGRRPRRSPRIAGPVRQPGVAEHQRRTRTPRGSRWRGPATPRRTPATTSASTAIG